MFKQTEVQEQSTSVLINNKHSLLVGGSRSGKTFKFLRTMVIRACKHKSRHLILRQTFNAVKISIWHDTFPSMMSLCFPNLTYKENKSDWFIELPNGSQIWFGGLDSKERTEKILGNEYSTIFFNEISQMNYDSVIMALTRLAERSGLKTKAYYDCNPPSPAHWSYKLFIKHQNPINNIQVDKTMYGTMLMNPMDNADNIDPDYIKDILEPMPDRQRRRFLLGEWVADIEGALWKQSLIDNNRVTEAPEQYQRVVVAIDPATTSKRNSDETGIVVGGIGFDGNCYIIEDLSGKYTPDQWAGIAISAYVRHKADRIIAEVNQGGDMVETIIKNIHSGVSYQSITAFRGKALRAEPVVHQYEQGYVKHVGSFHELETQMTTWIPSEGHKSPDRLDALVYVVTDLKVKQTITPKIVWA